MSEAPGTPTDTTIDTTDASTVRLTWIGHATVLIEVAGTRIITDPLLTRRVAHLRRRRTVPARPVDQIDHVLLSHVHMDHFHLPSLRKISGHASVVVPCGAAALARSAGFTRITEVAPGDRVAEPPLVVRATDASHEPGRGPHSRVEAPPVGFVVEAGGRRIYFAGDTDLFDGMSELGPIDVALIPIWGWGPSLGHGHLDPTRAAEAVAIIRPRTVVPIHWGTYAPEDLRRRMPNWFRHAPERFSSELAAIGELDRLSLIEPGSALQLDAA